MPPNRSDQRARLKNTHHTISATVKASEPITANPKPRIPGTAAFTPKRNSSCSRTRTMPGHSRRCFWGVCAALGGIVMRTIPFQRADCSVVIAVWRSLAFRQDYRGLRESLAQRRKGAKRTAKELLGFFFAALFAPLRLCARHFQKSQRLSRHLRSNVCSFSASMPAFSSLLALVWYQVKVSLIVLVSGRYWRPAWTALSQLMNMKPFKCGAASSGSHSGISLQAETSSWSRKSSLTHVNDASLSPTDLHSSSTLCIVIVLVGPLAL